MCFEVERKAGLFEPLFEENQVLISFIFDENFLIFGVNSTFSDDFC